MSVVNRPCDLPLRFPTCPLSRRPLPASVRKTLASMCPGGLHLRGPPPRPPRPALYSPLAGRGWGSHTHSGQHLPGTSTLLGCGQSQLGSRTSSLHRGTQVKPPSSQRQRILQWGWKVSPSRYRRPFTSQLPSSSPPGEQKAHPPSVTRDFSLGRTASGRVPHRVLSAELVQIRPGRLCPYRTWAAGGSSP